MRRAVGIIACVLLVGAWALALFFPDMGKVNSGCEYYECEWEDGTKTAERYDDLLDVITGISKEDNIALERGGLRGKIKADEVLLNALEMLRSMRLMDLLALTDRELTPLGRVAIFLYAKKILWIDGGEIFAYTGSGVQLTSRRQAEEIILLSGKIKAENLVKSRAATLTVCSAAAFTAEALVGSAVKNVIAYAPYSALSDAVYLKTAGGVRLIAGLPDAEELYVENADYLDEGALLPCHSLRSLSLPFVGNMRDTRSADYCGELGYLFSTGSEYYIPQTLEYLQVRGGSLTSFALYRCVSLRGIDACHAEEVAPDAFLSCPDLETVHAPNGELKLQGNFTRTLLSCGCTLYERIDQ